MKNLLAIALAGMTAVAGLGEARAGNERLELRRAALARLVELGGPEVLSGVASGHGASIFLSKGDVSTADASPEDLVETGDRAKRESATLSASDGMLVINRLNGDISMDIDSVGLSGTPVRYVCYGSSGTIFSGLDPDDGDVESIEFKVEYGSSWLSLSSPWRGDDGRMHINYTAQSNVGNGSRYGIIKCHERYWVDEQLVELCTWFPVGQCGDWMYNGAAGFSFYQNYSVLCYDWAADSGNGTGMRYVPIEHVSEADIRNLTFQYETENAKMVSMKANKSKLRMEYTFFANMSQEVKSCLTTAKIKGFSGQQRTWNFFAPKPEELLEKPQGLKVTVDLGEQVLCTWSEVDDATSYKVFRDGVLLGTTTKPRFVDKTGTVGKSYTYSVVAETSDGEVVVATSPTVKATGKSVPLELKSIKITAPSPVYAGRRYAKGLVCTATFNNGKSKKVKATWSVVKGRARVSSSGDLAVSPKAKDSVKVKAVYKYSGKTLKKTKTVKLTACSKEPEQVLSVKKLYVVGPGSIEAGATTNLLVYAKLSDGELYWADGAEWEQLTGTANATMSARGREAVVTAGYPSSVAGTLIKITWGDCSVVRRVEIVPPGVEKLASPVICADGGLVGVKGCYYSLALRTDSSLPTVLTVSGLPKDLGLSFDAKKGTIAGRPAKTGSFKITVTAKDEAGRTASKKLTLKVLKVPGWAKGTYCGLANYENYTNRYDSVDNQYCPYGSAAATFASSGKCSVKYRFTDDTETFSSGRFWIAVVENGKVTALKYKGTIKTATGKLPAYGEVTEKSFKLWSYGRRQVFAEMFRRISTSVRSEKTIISKVSGRNYTIRKNKLDARLAISSSGRAKLTGKSPKGRKLSLSCDPLVRDGKIYYSFVQLPTSSGGNGFYIYMLGNGTGLTYWFRTY